MGYGYLLSILSTMEPMKRLTLIFILLGLLAACDPLAPEDSQQVIVVTNTPTQPLLITTTPNLTNSLPTRPAPTATAVQVMIPTGTVPPCEETEGTLFESSFSSAIAGDDLPYNVYLPPCFFTSGRRYPYVILLHGSGYNYTQWADLGVQEEMDSGLANKSLPPMVLIMPEGGLFQEEDTFEAGQSYEDIILTELIPDLERNFCLITNRGGRAIGGISRGAFWAFSIAFRHPDLFSAVGGHSPFFSPDNAPNPYNPLALAETAPSIQNLRIFLDNSQSDISGPNTIVLSNTLRTRNITHEYAIHPLGNHDNDYWEAHLLDYLNFYGASWVKETAGLPSCQQ